MEIEMAVSAIGLHPTQGAFVLLQTKERKMFLPIGIGVFEAQFMELKCRHIKTRRPLTHDTIRATIDALGGKLKKVVITDFREHAYCATLHLETRGGLVLTDARSSDAVILALGAQLPIYVEDSVLEAAAKAREDPRNPAVAEWFESLDPDDLGKKM